MLKVFNVSFKLIGSSSPEAVAERASLPSLVLATDFAAAVVKIEALTLVYYQVAGVSQNPGNVLQ